MNVFDDDQEEKHLPVRDYMTQNEVAEVMGMTRGNVNQIERVALRKLKMILQRKNINKETLF